MSGRGEGEEGKGEEGRSEGDEGRSEGDERRGEGVKGRGEGVEVVEGRARIHFPSRNEVFYNPVQELNRDLRWGRGFDPPPSHLFPPFCPLFLPSLPPLPPSLPPSRPPSGSPSPCIPFLSSSCSVAVIRYYSEHLWTADRFKKIRSTLYKAKCACIVSVYPL